MSKVKVAGRLQIEFHEGLSEENIEKFFKGLSGNYKISHKTDNLFEHGDYGKIPGTNLYLLRVRHFRWNEALAYLNRRPEIKSAELADWENNNLYVCSIMPKDERSKEWPPRELLPGEPGPDNLYDGITGNP